MIVQVSRILRSCERHFTSSVLAHYSGDDTDEASAERAWSWYGYHCSKSGVSNFGPITVYLG